MKRKLRFQNLLFCELWFEKLTNNFRPPEFVSSSTNRNKLLITILLLFSAAAIAQEQTPPTEFPIGAHFGSGNRTTETLYERYAESGMNMMEQYATDSTRPYVSGYNLNALNMDKAQDYIYHYSTAYYSKWQAEQDTITPYIGVKHKFGQKAYWGDAWCWSTNGVTTPGDSLLFGPHYHQEKWYRRWLYDDPNMNGIYDVRYIPRWRMALDTTNSNLGPDDEVCRLSVWVRNAPLINGVWNDSVYDHLLKESVILKVSDFLANGQFDYFYFSNIPSQRWYRYPEKFQSPGDYYRLQELPVIPDDTIWVDINGENGVEFRVEWLRSDATCTLYVDYVEVYDDFGWKQFIEFPGPTANDIKNYALNFQNAGWDNIIHWNGIDEPFTIDSYIPIRTVDSLLRDIGAPPLMVHVYPYWNVKVNEDSQLVRYYKTAKPDPLNIHFFPFLAGYSSPRFDDWEAFRTQLQISYSLTKEKSFWYKVQNFGLDIGNDQWLVWRQPNPSEQNAEVMLALAHGVKGLGISHFDSYPSDYQQEIPYILQGLIKDDPPAFTRTELFNYFRDSIIPRLKGTFGKTLMNLDYTGNFVRIVQEPIPPEGQFPSTSGYLSLSCSQAFYHFHAGLLHRKAFIDDTYFLLVNLKPTSPVRVTINNNFGHPNLRIKYVENPALLDTTILVQFIKDIPMPFGEGYLFQVAPVVKYGGRLIYNETISNPTTLIDEMIIENAATLTINTTYNADRDIRIKAGGRIVTTTGGTIKFYEGSKLIVEGTATISGTAQNKLVLDFLSPSDSNGIVIKPGGSLTILNCEIKNAGTGIFSELNADSLIVEYVDFIDCQDNSISIAGRSGEEDTTPIKINNCTIENSVYGISVYNTSSILIRWNDITDTDCGIYLSNVSDALIVCNSIESSNEELQGILALSSGGIFYGNMISGHTSAIQLGNSSPKIGVNTITDNKYHGIYVGAGSNPYMKGEYIGNPAIPYGLSGYNEIYENGGYEGEQPPDNDGSEIYFYNSTAVLDSGCNVIKDDRQVSPPLINTLLLMSRTGMGLPITINARNNFWGDTVYAARFSGMTVNYRPNRIEPCEIPIGGGEDELVLMTQFGDVIDTVYSTGEEVTGLSSTEPSYAEAEEYFLTGDLTNALLVYEGIINSTATEEEKYYAYQRKYSIGKLTGQSAEYFNQLSNTFAALASNTQDTLSNKILSQFSTLSKVGEQEYETAIGEFDGIVQQNPNTEEAVYAEIDALTTALLIEEADSTLQKGRLGKYLIKSSANYHQRVDEILRKNFGSGSKETEKELLPTEYTLYQNYPNPFNPVTTIKYDLPNTSEVILIIYDILGRKIKELVNTKQQAGKYEVQFDASNLASGVYIYQLVAEKYISSKKMILLK